MSLSEDEPDPATVPIRVVETTLAAYQWDDLRGSAEVGFARAQRRAIVAGVLAAAALAAAGIALLPNGSKVSVAVYTPVVGVIVWSWARGALRRRALSSAVARARDVVVPALVDGIESESLMDLLTYGKALVTQRSTVIVEDRRDSLVALIASEYDMSKLPPAAFRSSGGGP